MQKRRTLSPHSKQRGQALLIVVLIMVIALTVGLSIATRSLTNTRVSSEQQSSQQAFSAAEAGVERYLNNTETQSQISGNLGTGAAGFNASMTTAGSSQLLLDSGNQVPKDDGVDLWLSHYNSGASDPTPMYANPWQGQFTLYWGSSSETCTPPKSANAAAVEVVVLYGASPTNPKAFHYAFDPCKQGGINGRQGMNNFTDVSGNPGGTVNGTAFQYSATIDIADSNPGPDQPAFIARIIPLYSSTPMGIKVNSGGDLPPQGKQIVSTGNSGGTERKISVFQSYPRLPIELFPYTIFSPCDAGSPGC